MDKIECVLEWNAIVGESPLWHETEARLYWVDIQGKQIHRFDPLTKHNETFGVPDLVTSLAFRKSGGLILSLRKNFAFFHPDSGKLEMLKSVEDNLPENRFNDGRCDPAGRFWAGTMAEKDWKAPVGNLYCFDKNQNLTLMKDQVACSNGTAWSPDGKTMYHTESFRYAIFAYDFDLASGAIKNRRVFAEMDPKGADFPDGLTVDAEGGVWSNHVGHGKIVRYDQDGRIERTLQLPVPRATACTFGGKDLDTLYITSARETLSEKEILAAPLSGSLFAMKPGVKGLSPSYFG